MTRPDKRGRVGEMLIEGVHIVRWCSIPEPSPAYRYGWKEEHDLRDEWRWADDGGRP